jgi:hypothetical protein
MNARPCTPYHKGEKGDYRNDPHEIPMGRGGVGQPPKGMMAPACSSAIPQAPHAHINGGEVPGHFYRIEFPAEGLGHALQREVRDRQ